MPNPQHEGICGTFFALVISSYIRDESQHLQRWLVAGIQSNPTKLDVEEIQLLFVSDISVGPWRYTRFISRPGSRFVGIVYVDPAGEEWRQSKRINTLPRKREEEERDNGLAIHKRAKSERIGWLTCLHCARQSSSSCIAPAPVASAPVKLVLTIPLNTMPKFCKTHTDEAPTRHRPACSCEE